MANSDNCLTAGLTGGKAEPQVNAPKIGPQVTEGRKSVPFKQSQEPNPPGGVNFQS